jgi:hypothetical protein
MAVGQTFDCDLDVSRSVLGLDLSVGCNDGETGTYSVTFDQGPPVALNGACNSSIMLSGVNSRFIHLNMTAGGGADNQISFQSWSVLHY